jgi:hypothetical protein
VLSNKAIHVLWRVACAGATGPSCPHALSRLIFVASFCWLDCLQMLSLSFPWVLFGLAALIQALGAACFGLEFLGYPHAHVSL